jgi:hypothetical protein
VPCGCTFAQAPDERQCDAILAWHVRAGNYSDVKLDDLNIVGVVGFEGNIWTGEAKNSAMGFFIDERADESQREAVQAIWGGEARGWPAGFAQLFDEVRGIEYVPIEFEIADDLAAGEWRSPGGQGQRRGADGTYGSGGSARAGPQRPRNRGWPGPGRHLGHRQGGRDRGIRLQVELAREVEQALPFDWSSEDQY